MNSEEVVPIFIGVWVLYSLVRYLIFFVSKDTERKKKLWTRFNIFGGALFIGLAYLMGIGQHIYILALMVVLFFFLNIRSAKFCSACGKTNLKQNFLPPAKFCNNCGEALE